MTIGVAELMYPGRWRYTFKGSRFPATLVYLVLSFLITGLMTLYNRKVLQPIRGH
jgi:hypothetical protein